jgi:hypothetical protein
MVIKQPDTEDLESARSDDFEFESDLGSSSSGLD